MPTLADAVRSPFWWLSAVVLAVAVNILSAYAKPAIDRTLGRWSSTRRQKNARIDMEYQQRVARLIEMGAQGITLEAIVAADLRMRAVTCVVGATVGFVGAYGVLNPVVNTPVPLIVIGALMALGSTILLIAAKSGYERADRTFDDIQEARRRMHSAS